MEQYFIENLTVRYSPEFNYVWVVVAEQTDAAQFGASLADASFHQLLRRYDVKNILLDCGKMWVFSIPEMSNYLDQTFTALMRENGVEKISVVINEEMFSVLSFIFQGIESKHDAPQIRFFSTAQFYDSFETVDWF